MLNLIAKHFYSSLLERHGIIYWGQKSYLLLLSWSWECEEVFTSEVFHISGEKNRNIYISLESDHQQCKRNSTLWGYFLLKFSQVHCLNLTHSLSCCSFYQSNKHACVTQYLHVLCVKLLFHLFEILLKHPNWNVCQLSNNHKNRNKIK